MVPRKACSWLSTVEGTFVGGGANAEGSCPCCAAREPVAADSLAIGRTVIRNLVRDPLLPDELRPGETRRRLTGGMIAYQLRAKALWIRLLDQWAAGG